MFDIFTLWSPHKLLKNLGELSEYAKCNQSSTKKKKIEIFTLNPWYNGMVKKPTRATVPLNGSVCLYVLFSVRKASF